jgi:type IV pilus assembly protein PilA
MLSTLQKRREEDGFTLIELMVVVLIIAILIAIAIPTFLGAQDRARDRAAQSDLRNGITAAKTIATDDAGLMSSVDEVTLADAEGSLTFVDGAGTTTVVGVIGGATSTANDSYVLLHKQSASDKWFGIVARSTGQVQYCQGDAVGDVNDPAACTDSEW